MAEVSRMPERRRQERRRAHAPGGPAGVPGFPGAA